MNEIEARKAAAEAAFDEPNGKAVCVVCIDGVYSLHENMKGIDRDRLAFVAQRWDDNTVQLRFDGARSEWVKR